MDTNKRVNIHILKHIQYNMNLQIKRCEAVEKALLSSLRDLDIIIEHEENFHFCFIPECPACQELRQTRRNND